MCVICEGVFKSCLLYSMLSGLLVIPGVSTCYSRCVYLALCYPDVVIKDYYFEVLPRLRVPRLSLLCAPWQKTRPNSKRRPFTSFCFVRFFKFVILFLCFVPRGKRVRTPRALMLAVRGSLRRRSRLSHPAVRGSLRRRLRLSHPAVRGSLRRRSRLSHPAVRGSSRRRSRLSHPAVRRSSRRRSRINLPTVHRRWRHHPRLTLAYRPAADSMPAGLPLTQCPPACLWLNARRPAADSSSPDCRWLKLAGLPLTQARRIAADSSSPDCRWLMPAGRRWQGKPTRSSVHAAVCGSPTPPFAGDHAAGHGESQPTVGGCLYNAGKANPPSAVHSARSRLRLPPARRPLPLSGQASRLLPLLSSQPIMVSPAGRCRIDKPAGRGRIWPVSDHGLFNCFCVFSPGGLLIPLSFPKEIFGGG